MIEGGGGVVKGNTLKLLVKPIKARIYAKEKEFLNLLNNINTLIYMEM